MAPFFRTRCLYIGMCGLSNIYGGIFVKFLKQAVPEKRRSSRFCVWYEKPWFSVKI